jgi:hypothetical protein
MVLQCFLVLFQHHIVVILQTSSFAFVRLSYAPIQLDNSNFLPHSGIENLT